MYCQKVTRRSVSNGISGLERKSISPIESSILQRLLEHLRLFPLDAHADPAIMTTANALNSKCKPRLWTEHRVRRWLEPKGFSFSSLPRATPSISYPSSLSTPRRMDTPPPFPVFGDPAPRHLPTHLPQLPTDPFARLGVLPHRPLFLLLVHRLAHPRGSNHC